MNTIADWETLQQLVNEDESTTIPADALTIETALGTASYAPLNDKNVLDIRYVQQQGEWKNSLKIRLTNTTAKNLYVCCIHFLTNFECHTSFLNPQVYQLNAGTSIELNQNSDTTLEVSLSEFIKWYNWKAELETLKFIISTENFDETLLNIEGLTPPPIPDKKRSQEEEAVNRGITKTGKPAVRGWRTVDVKLTYHNPLYNTIKEEDLKAMLLDEDTHDFARGLYFEQNAAELPGIVRPDIQVITTLSKVEAN